MPVFAKVSSAVGGDTGDGEHQSMIGGERGSVGELDEEPGRLTETSIHICVNNILSHFESIQ